MGGGLEDGDDLGRPWLRPLLKTDFFMPCQLHADARKSKSNMYCLECTRSPLCTNCLADHSEHHVVQTYIIKNPKVVFLNIRSQERRGKGVTNTCESCGHLLLDASSRFCSLGCKLGDIKDVPRQTFALHPKPG